MKMLPPCAVLVIAIPAVAGVSVVAPLNNSNVATSVQYVATATTTCAQGVSAMGIYKAPYVLVYTVSGSKLNTVLSLSPGTYITVVQEWDNCGGSTKTPVAITVAGSQSGGSVQVAAPANNSAVSPTVQFVASATTNCTAGVAALGSLVAVLLPYGFQKRPPIISTISTL